MVCNIAFTDFISNSLELTLDMEVALLRLQRSPTDTAIASAIPSATRAVKELADAQGCQHIVAFSCAFEGVLSRVRDAKLRAEPELIVLLLSCCGHVSEMVYQLATRDTESLSKMPAGDLEKSFWLVLQLRSHQLRAHHQYRQNLERTWQPANVT